jgi:hypothetical protein
MLRKMYAVVKQGWNRHLVLFAACHLYAATALASGGPPMLTDDPGTPGDGHWELNVAGLSSRSSQGTIYQLPLLDMNYGWGERLQLKFEAPWLWQRSDAGMQNAAGKALLGVKWRFLDQGEQGWQVSTYPQTEFGLSSHSAHLGLSAPGTNYLLPLEVVYGFDGFDLNIEAGRWLRQDAAQDSWIGGIVVTHEVRKGVELLAEIHHEQAVHQSQSELILNFGARYDLSEETTLLLALGHDVRNTLNPPQQWMSYVGLQFHF